MDDRLSPLYDAIVAGSLEDALAGLRAALEAGLDPARILNEGMIAAMQEVGALFEDGEYFVPDMLVSARTMQAALALLKPHLPKTETAVVGKVVIGTVQGDLHDIGKNLVALMLEGAGYEICDLGINVAPQVFVQAVQAQQPALLAMSALLTTTMPAMKTTIEALRKAGLRDQVKIIVGGAPLTPAYAELIGADGFAPDASRAVALAASLVAVKA
jgi:5-methyltetrahydrofolate--homocysteine methyltransferase